MDTTYSAHNLHLIDTDTFTKNDPHLNRLAKLPLVHTPKLLDELPIHQPGIYSIGGARQIGKTTILKQWMAHLLKKGIPAQQIYFMTGELIDDQHALVNLVQAFVGELPEQSTGYLLLDEVSYIKDWDKGVKFLADAGLLETIVLLLTGSDLVFIQEARMRFPGRRGQAAQVDFHLYPLSFKETVLLKHKQDPANLEKQIDLLNEALEQYLIHGGFLPAINDMAKNHALGVATLNTYMDWIRGDMLRRGKREHYLREILSAIIRSYGSQVTWNALAQQLSIDHPQTVADYAAVLQSMDVLIIQQALLEDKLTGAPKKARKLCFSDPFIFHAVRHWLDAAANPYQDQILRDLRSPETAGKLAEACAVSHVHRKFPTYYIKAEGEVDIAYMDGHKFWPIEVKWTGQVRNKDLKQILKYPNGSIWAKKENQFNPSIPVENLASALFKL